MLRDGNYLEANQLKEGQSLMPLYRKTYDGRERAYSPSNKLKGNWKQIKGRWEYTYLLVAKQIYGDYKGMVVHHLDENKNNNAPDNLTLMTKYDHDVYHRVKYNQSLEGRENARKNLKNSCILVPV
jgi:hypothetical protein